MAIILNSILRCLTAAKIWLVSLEKWIHFRQKSFPPHYFHPAVYSISLISIEENILLSASMAFWRITVKTLYNLSHQNIQGFSCLENDFHVWKYTFLFMLNTPDVGIITINILLMAISFAFTYAIVKIQKP